MFKTIIEGLNLGLATGSTCLATCTPIYLPFIMQKSNTFSKNIGKIMEISAGRFVSYLLFGALSGYLGSVFSKTNREIFTLAAYLLLIVFMIFSFVRADKEHKGCNTRKVLGLTNSAFLLGVITGINFCPSFLFALSRVFQLGGALAGVQLFTGFFVGTSLFLLPLAIAGKLSKLNRIKLIAKYASLLVAFYFLYLSVGITINLIKTKNSVPKQSQKERVVDLFNPNNPVIIFANTNSEIEELFYEALKNKGINQVEIKYDFVFSDQDNFKNYILIFGPDIKFPENYISSYDTIILDENIDIAKTVNFLKKHSFRVEKVLNWSFKK